MARYILGITGASGVVYGIRLLKVLLDKGYPLDLVITSAGNRILGEELGLHLSGAVDEQKKQLLKYLKRENTELNLHNNEDIGAEIASGSCLVDAMVVIPCSMGTLASISAGLSSNLLERTADVTLKEGRRLLLVPRETPLNSIHLENMLKLSRMGTVIIPAMPSFYIHPQSIEDLIDFVVGRVLDQLGIRHQLYARWGEKKIGRKE